MTSRGIQLLRDRASLDATVSSMELFFDLVYVLAITQLTHHLLHHFSIAGAAQTLLLLLAIWLAWNYTSWFTNYFDPARGSVRLLLLALMLASIVTSASIPEAFAETGLAFASGYVAIQLTRNIFAVCALDRTNPLHGVHLRALIWWTVSGAFWIAGGLTHPETRILLWIFAAGVEVLGLASGFPILRLGRSRTADYTIAGEHLAERCQLFVLLALGESILVTGVSVGKLPSSVVTWSAFVVAFANSAATWWIYFDRTAKAGSHAIAKDANPGRLGVLAYTWFHLPIVGGIIVSAAADEIVLGHAADQATLGTAAVVLGGPALFLVGNALFNAIVLKIVPWSRILAILALVALALLALVFSPAALHLSAAATTILIGVAAWDYFVSPR